MKRSTQAFTLTGIALLTVVVLVLVASPNFIFTPAITVLGGDPNKATTDQVSVTTLTDLSDPERMKAFPLDIGKWHGRDYESAQYLEILKVQAVLIRAYDPETFTQPLFLIIVQGNSESSIHEPHYCFPNIQEQAKEELVITDPKFTRGQPSVTVPLNKLVSARTNKEGRIIERRVVLYFFVKANQFYSDDVALVEVQALAPLEGPYESTLNEQKEFLAEVVPLLFAPASDEEWQPIARTLSEKGAGGWAVMAIMGLIPIAIMAYPWIRGRAVKEK